jgi:hypothetical protein
MIPARMMEQVDLEDLKSSALVACGFESRSAHFLKEEVNMTEYQAALAGGFFGAIVLDLVKWVIRALFKKGLKTKKMRNLVQMRCAKHGMIGHYRNDNNDFFCVICSHEALLQRCINAKAVAHLDKIMTNNLTFFGRMFLWFKLWLRRFMGYWF